MDLTSLNVAHNWHEEETFPGLVSFLGRIGFLSPRLCGPDRDDDECVACTSDLENEDMNSGDVWPPMAIAVDAGLKDVAEWLYVAHHAKLVVW